jgi:hypothetical protein
MKTRFIKNLHTRYNGFSSTRYFITLFPAVKENDIQATTSAVVRGDTQSWGSTVENLGGTGWCSSQIGSAAEQALT